MKGMMGREASFGGGVFEASVVFFSVGCLFERGEFRSGRERKYLQKQ